MALERQRNAMPVARQLDQHVAMAARRARRNHAVPDASKAFQRRKRSLQSRDQRLRPIELSVSQPGPRLGAMQRRRSRGAAAWRVRHGNVSKSRASPALPGLRTGAAQHRQLQRFDRALERARARAEPTQRMFQQRQQRRRLQPLRHRLGREPRENSCRGVHQRVAAGIVECEIPAAERRHYPPRQRAVRRHQRGRSCPDAAPRASQPQSRAPPSRDWRPRSPRGPVMPAAILLGDFGLRQPLMPLRGRVRRPHRFRGQYFAPMCRAAAPRISTSRRSMPNRCSSACIANCGWLEAGWLVNLPCASLTPPIHCQASSSRSVSRPGSTTAPCGRLATACRNFAVAGIDPVEPAAITGPS